MTEIKCLEFGREAGSAKGSSLPGCSRGAPGARACWPVKGVNLAGSLQDSPRQGGMGRVGRGGGLGKASRERRGYAALFPKIKLII